MHVLVSTKDGSVGWVDNAAVAVRARRAGHTVRDARVSGAQGRGLPDSGAALSAAPSRLLCRLGTPVSEETRQVVYSASGVLEAYSAGIDVEMQSATSGSARARSKQPRRARHGLAIRTPACRSCSDLAGFLAGLTRASALEKVLLARRGRRPGQGRDGLRTAGRALSAARTWSPVRPTRVARSRPQGPERRARGAQRGRTPPDLAPTRGRRRAAQRGGARRPGSGRPPNDYNGPAQHPRRSPIV